MLPIQKNWFVRLKMMATSKPDHVVGNQTALWHAFSLREHLRQQFSHWNFSQWNATVYMDKASVGPLVMLNLLKSPYFH